MTVTGKYTTNLLTIRQCCRKLDCGYSSRRQNQSHRQATIKPLEIHKTLRPKVTPTYHTTAAVAGPQHCRVDFTKLSHLRRRAGCLGSSCMLVTALLLVHPATTQYFPGMARINPTPTSQQITKHGAMLRNHCPVGNALRR